MARKNHLLLFTTSFLSGFAAGLLFTPQTGSQNRAWLTKNASKLGRWAKLQKLLAHRKSDRELSAIQKNVQQGIRQHIPDLYESTEHISLGNLDHSDE
ncbi:MAG: hypothetical protein ACQEST_12420 [Bacteroidota bacterium]